MSKIFLPGTLEIGSVVKDVVVRVHYDWQKEVNEVCIEHVEWAAQPFSQHDYEVLAQELKLILNDPNLENESNG